MSYHIFRISAPLQPNTISNCKLFELFSLRKRLLPLFTVLSGCFHIFHKQSYFKIPLVNFPFELTKSENQTNGFLSLCSPQTFVWKPLNIMYLLQRFSKRLFLLYFRFIAKSNLLLLCLTMSWFAVFYATNVLT